ncbi:MAG: hypothetical protein APR63_00290 [Desulfuromonas sp. SDB]|nr:MAG: hypothetical protein APR63_00290 [Desulfuromonas sp. SDB]
MENYVVISPPLEIDSVDWKNGILWVKSLNREFLLTVGYLPWRNLADSSYYLYLPREETLQLEIQSESEEFSPPPGEELQIGGEQAFGFRVEEGGQTEIDQDISLSFYGRIFEDVQFRGHLEGGNSDVPVPLSELDKVYLEMISPLFEATVGDMEIIRTSGIFGDIRQDILGINLNVLYDQHKAGGFYGEIRSENQVAVIDVDYGFQGPYPLDAQQQYLQILSGSEKVYVNGSLLDFSDYEINSYKGTITFSPDITLNDDDKVIVYYQTTNFEYRRYLYSTGYQWNYSWFTAGISRITLQDIKDSPLGFSMTTSTQQLLTSLGDSAGRIWVDGGTYVGLDKGYYDRVDSIYVYQGYEQGDYNVNFSYVDSTQGDYVYNYTIAGYQYVGEGQGNYLAKIKVQPPVKRQADIFELSVIKPAFQIKVDAARSFTDWNLFSPKDDDDNYGWGGLLDLTVINPKFQITGTYARMDDLFYSFNQRGLDISLAEFSSYLLPGGSFKNFQLTTSSLGNFFMSLKGAQLNNEYDHKSSIAFNAELTFDHSLIGMGYQNQQVDSGMISPSSLRIIKYQHNYNLIARTKIFSFIPWVNLSRKDYGDSLDYRRYQALCRLTWVINTSLSWNWFYHYSRYYLNQNQHSYLYTVDADYGSQLQYYQPSRVISIYISRKIRENEQINLNPDLDYYLAKLEYQEFRGGKKIIAAQYQLNRELLVSKKPIYQQVEEGQGNYSYDSVSGEYYLDIHGNYLRSWQEIDSQVPVTQVNFTFSAFPYWNNYGLDVTVKFKEVSKYDNIYKLIWFDPEHTFNQDYTVSALRHGSIKLHYRKDNLRLYSGINRELIFSRESEINQQVNRLHWYGGGDFRNLHHLRFQCSYNYEQIEQFEYRGKSEQQTAEGSCLYGYGWGDIEPQITVTAGYSEYFNYIGYPQLGKFHGNSYDLVPGVLYKSKLRVDLQAGIKTVAYSIQEVPPGLAAVDYPGLTYHWRIYCNYSFSQNIYFYLQYWGEKIIDRGTFQNFSMGVRFIF